MDGISDVYNYPGGQKVDTPYETAEDRQVNVDDFLQLMIAQLKNQDFTNPVDDTQYVTQLAQFATMQQMQELAYYSKSNYVMSMVGKTVTAASLSLGGKVNKVVGPVEKIVLSNKEFMVYVKGNPYSLSQIMEVNDVASITEGELDKAKNMAIRKGDFDSDSVEIAWDAPTDDEVLKDKLTYSVYYSTENDFNEPNEVRKGTLAGTVSGADELEFDITGLEPDTTYFVNIIVKSETGAEQTYQKMVFTTEPL